MHSGTGRKQSRLPKRFPVGTIYVVEGRGGENGHLRVFSRYLILPSGERINLGADSAKPARSRARRHVRNRGASRTAKSSAPSGGTSRSARAKKIMARAGT